MDIRDEYFEWMYQLIDGKGYRELLNTLYCTEFIYTIPMDENRLVDGVNLRYKFARDCGYPGVAVRLKFDNDTCSVLEVMIALAIRMEQTILEDETKGDRTYEWFWTMIKSLGLYDMTDDTFDVEIVEDIMDKFLNREYTYDGFGSLFYVPETDCDMRLIEIWSQASIFINVLLDI